MRHLVSTILLATLALTGCGTQAALAPSVRTAAAVKAQGNGYSGCYLSLNLAPSPELEKQAADLRAILGFVDMSKAQPPRAAGELHVTIGYFQKLAAVDANRLGAEFRGRTASVTVEGYGVANNQAAYFTVEGVQQARKAIQGLKLPYEADDAHITFGVSPSAPRDVHNVPKKAQRPLGTLTLTGEFHLMQGSRPIW